MAKIKINGDSSGYVEIAAPNAANNNTLELGPGTKILTDSNPLSDIGSIGIATDNPGSGNILAAYGRTQLGPQSDTSDATTKAEMISKASLRVKPHPTNSGTLNFAQVDNGSGIGLQFTNGAGTSNWNMVLQPFGGKVAIGTDSPNKVLKVEYPDPVSGSDGLTQKDAGNDTTTFFGTVGPTYNYIGHQGHAGMLYSSRDLAIGVDHNNNGVIKFYTGNNERLRIQSSGYVGIGEDAPGGRLTVKHANTATSGLNATLKLKQGVATNGNRSSLIFSSLDDYDVAAVNGVVDTHSGTAANNVGHLEFWTKKSGTATAQERMRVHPTGEVSINSTGYMGRFHIQQDALTEPALCIRHHDASLYKHMGTVGPNDRNGTDASTGGQYLHVRVRTVWNDSSMTMFRITGYYSYHDYTHSYVGMYRYGSNSYRTNPYGQTINNLKRATIHSIYNEAASPGYLVFVCDWGTNYTGLMFEHIGAGGAYGSYMQNDIEIIDSLRSTGTSALTF